MGRNGRRRGIAVASALTMALLVNSFGFLLLINRIQAAPSQRLYLKWVKDVGVCTYIGPLAADLIPEPPGSPRVLEIVVTGVSQIESGFTNGTVTVLNGTNGNVLWTAQPGKILNHSPIEIADLNKDGLPEIVVANMRSTSALYGNGSLYWTNTAAPSYDLYSTIADVNQDGYPEVFVSSGYAPYEGIDYFTQLSHDGQILRQSNTSWHPCWGGLALGSPNFDGNYILLQGDRSSSSGPSGDRYKYGGWGVRALDARTLTPLWNDSSVTCSSHIPMFADVDGDGVLDVVVAMQSSGLAVYNALNGSVLTSGGKYRQTWNMGLSSHSPPTIYDIDGDGHPEIITCRDSNPKIFDLYTWSLDAVLNIVTGEPPKMGRVTADPTQMNIIAVEGNNIHVYNQQYQEVDNATYLDNPNQFTLVQDVDGDGYNELLLSSRSGKVYCYGTPALVSNPPPRSNVAFYSEYRRGVAEFVEPPGARANTAPDISNPSPANGSSGLSVTLSNLFFTLTDKQNDRMNYTVTTSPNVGSGSGTNVTNGMYNVSINGLQNSTTYMWLVNVTDGLLSNLATFNFTTAATPPPNTPPQVTAPIPSNGATGVSVTLSNLFFSLSDADNDLMNYSVVTVPNIGIGNGMNVANGIYNISIGGLQYSTGYSWQVNVTDGKNGTVVNFTFTTAALPLNNPPQVTLPIPSNGATGVPLTQSYLFFNLNDADNDLMNYTVVTTPSIGSGSSAKVANGQYNVSISGLQYSTAYEWQVNVTDGKNNTVVTFSFTTGGPPPSQEQWWDAGWQYRLNVTIDHTKVTANLINFPVLIDLTSSSLATHAQVSGNDIVFIDYSGHKLNHEIETYNSASGHLVAWVLISNLSSTTNTVISLYYGNPSSPNQQNPNDVWDSNFLLVQHLNATSSAQRDSTSNHNDGTTTGAVTTGTPGKIAGAISFTGGYMTLPTVLSSQTQFTFSAWIYAQSGARYFISEWANSQGAFLQVVGNNYVQFYVNSIMVQKSVTLNQWHYVVATYNGSVIDLWVDGGSASSVSASGLTWPSQNTYVGDRYDHARQFIGLVDEVRVSSIARSNDWINIEYIDQNAPSTFYTIGIEEVQTSNPPIVSNPSPIDGATEVNFNPTLSVQINDTQGQPMVVYFRSNETGLWQLLGSYSNLPNGIVTQTTTTINSYATTYYWRVEVTDGTNWTNKTFQFTTKLPPPGNWYNSSWQYRTNITVSHTQVNSNLANYPLLVDFTSPSLIGNTQVNGQDFVFTDTNNQKLDHQIESYDSTTGRLTAWVRIPLLSSTTDTVIFMYYGNPTCSDQQNSTGVWDSNYSIVLHLNDGPVQSNDSTINRNNGTISGNVNQVQGKIDGCYSFTGGNVTLPNVFSGQTRFTFSAWIYAQSGARYFISEWANNLGAFVQVVGDGNVQFYINGMMVQKPVSLNQWHYVVGTYDGITMSLWVDGGSPSSTLASAPVWPSQNLYLGNRYDNQRTFYGLIDEVRVSNIARSNDWVNTEYLNQNNPSVFYIVGLPESFSP